MAKKSKKKIEVHYCIRGSIFVDPTVVCYPSDAEAFAIDLIFDKVAMESFSLETSTDPEDLS